MDINIQITRVLMSPPAVTVTIKGIEKDEIEGVVRHVTVCVTSILEANRPLPTKVF